MIAAVILAAGAGRRLGTVAKAVLEDARGRTFLAAVHDTARAAGVTRSVVVVGPPHAGATTREAERLGLEVAVNPDPGRGMASSVEIGFAHAGAHFAGCRAALLWPVDHPAVGVATARAIAEAAGERRVIIPVRGGRGGHPTAFGRALWPRLAACSTEPRGARSVIHGLEAGRVVRLDVADPGVIADVDTPADLASARGGDWAAHRGDKPDTLPGTGE